LERIQTGKEEAAKALLEEGFSKQADGMFRSEYMQGSIPKYLEMLKPENVEEVKNVLMNFGPPKTQK
jgi:hypothetical protein